MRRRFRCGILVIGVALVPVARGAEASEIVQTGHGPARRFYVTHLHALAARCYGYLDITADTVEYIPAPGQPADHGFQFRRSEIAGKTSALTYPEVHLQTPDGVRKFIVVDRDMVERVRSAAATRAHTQSPKLLADAIVSPRLPEPKPEPLPVPPTVAPPTAGVVAAAEAESVESLLDRGWAYREGRGVAQSFEQAATWFEKAANRGSAAARYDLAVLFLYGLAGPANQNKARGLLYLAADDKYAPALRLLGVLELSEGNRDRGFDLLVQAATLNDRDALFLAGSLAYERRKESSEMWAHALEWLERAARAGHPAADALASAAWLSVPTRVFALVPPDYRPAP